MTQTILILAIAYGLVAVLVVLVVLSARVPRLLKGAVTLLVAALLFTTYRGIGELRGLPSDAPPPDSFILYWAQISEPNEMAGDPGRIFLWLVETDALNYPVGEPRAHGLPYSDDLAAKVAEAQRLISNGEDIAGAVEQDHNAPSPFDGSMLEEGDEQSGASGDIGDTQIFMELGNITFGTAEAPIQPEKQN